MRSLTFGKSVFSLRISGVDDVISIELKIDWTNESFGLMFIKGSVREKWKGV